jgi:hypothetical protein
MQAFLRRWIAEFLDLGGKVTEKVFQTFVWALSSFLLLFSHAELFVVQWSNKNTVVLVMKNNIVRSEPRSRLAASLVAKFIVPDCGNKDDSGTGLSYTTTTAYVAWRARIPARPAT